MTSSTASQIEPLYVLDTHPLIWYLTKDKRLSKGAAEIFAAAERLETQLLVSAIVIAEMYYADKKHKLFADFEQVYTELKSKPFYVFVDFRPDDVLDFTQDFVVPEMHDRIIVGLARRLAAPLITHDTLIVNLKLVNIA